MDFDAEMNSEEEMKISNGIDLNSLEPVEIKF